VVEHRRGLDGFGQKILTESGGWDGKETLNAKGSSTESGRRKGSGREIGKWKERETERGGGKGRKKENAIPHTVWEDHPQLRLRLPDTMVFQTATAMLDQALPFSLVARRYLRRPNKDLYPIPPCHTRRRGQGKFH